MPKYRTNWHLAIDGKSFEPGEEIELTETKAASIGACVSPVAKPAKAPKAAEGDAKKAESDKEGAE